MTTLILKYYFINLNNMKKHGGKYSIFTFKLSKNETFHPIHLQLILVLPSFLFLSSLISKSEVTSSW